MPGPYGDSTRCLKAVGAQAVPGQPVAPGPVPASTYHLSSDEFEELDTYGRSSNPTWRQLESAIAQLEGATAALVFGSGMAAITSVLRALVRPRGVLVVPAELLPSPPLCGRILGTPRNCNARGDRRPDVRSGG